MFFLIKKPAWLDIARTGEKERARKYEIGMRKGRSNARLIVKDNNYYLKVGDKWMEMKNVDMKELVLVGKEGEYLGVLDRKYLISETSKP